jgi:hypothetical protein
MTSVTYEVQQAVLKKLQETPEMGKENQAMRYNMSGRGFASVARATAAAAALCFAVSAPATAGDQPPTSASPAKGEFDNSSAMDLASVNW